MGGGGDRVEALKSVYTSENVVSSSSDRCFSTAFNNRFSFWVITCGCERLKRGFKAGSFVVTSNK